MNEVMFEMFSETTFSTTVGNVYEVIKNTVFSIWYVKTE